jgi:hypothetical protein
VTPGLAVWNAAIQASWPAAIDDAPDPSNVPESAAEVSVGPVPSFAAQPASSSELVAKAAAIFVVFFNGSSLLGAKER